MLHWLSQIIPGLVCLVRPHRWLFAGDGLWICRRCGETASGDSLTPATPGLVPPTSPADGFSGKPGVDR